MPTAELKNKEVSPKVIHMVEDGEPQDLNVFIRGNVNRKGPLAPRGFIKVLSRQGQPLAGGRVVAPVGADVFGNFFFFFDL